MSELVHLLSTDQRAEAAFVEFCEAARRAQTSHDVADGISAGRAWAAFLAVFAPVPGGGDVLSLRPREPAP